MAELKEVIKFSDKLSLLYIDEDKEFLQNISEVLRKVFLKLDDANDATEGIGFAKFNSYDLIIIDSMSSAMTTEQFVKNIQEIHKYQNIIVVEKNLDDKKILELYKLGVSAIVSKPLKISVLLDAILRTISKVAQERVHLSKEITTLNETLLYERKRIGRFMANEKKLTDTIEAYQNNIDTNKNIYELTKLPNKYALQHAIDETGQTLLYINIDHFDFVNTIYGMGKANKLLKECASRLKKFMPENGRLFHITADEFVVLLDDPQPNQDMILAKQIQSLFKEAPIEFDEFSHFIVFSIGIDSGKGKILFVNAKSASKEARYFGGDQIIIYDVKSDYMLQQRENLFWIEKLKKAFEEDRIVTFYQPIINNRDINAPKHYEVLCRLVDTDGKVISADKFIHSAKLAGLAIHITKTMIDKTFKQFKSNDFSFSLNISMYDLHQNYLLDFLKYKCERYNITPDRVYLEIVKDVILEKSSTIDKQIKELRAAGFRIVIDNFGSDAIIYKRIFELEAEFIKIDGALIKELANQTPHSMMIESIIKLAHKGGIKIIAEHVENIELYEMVKKCGIDYSQGFAIAKPALTL
ncbi:MAG: EAL domain-containing protein [Sulfurimonadaceae bacterium]|nr:EAL domain-containing protein [Sulfurimonadaceae bacterium]